MLDHRRGPAFASAQHRADPGREFRQLERLHDVVVCAGVESLDTVTDGIARGHDHDRQGGPALSQVLQYLQAFPARQAEVEQAEIIGAGVQRMLGRGAVLHPVHGEPLLMQSGR